MAFEWRGNRRHYYYKVRDGKTVRGVHVGRPLTSYFAGLAAARNAQAQQMRVRRSSVESTTQELKRLLGYWALLQAALLYAAGFYRQSGSWRPHVRAKLFLDPSGEPHEDRYYPFNCSSTPEGPASRAAAELDFVLHWDCQRNPIDDPGRLDRVFGTLGEVVRGLDRRDAYPGDLWVLRNLNLRPLFDAWMRRASRLNIDLLTRLGPVTSNGKAHLSDVQRDVLVRAHESARVEHDGRTWSWNGDEANPSAPSAGYPLGIVATVAAAASYLTALDRLTLGAYRGACHETYSEKQWALALGAARARQARAKRHLLNVVLREKRYVAALADAGDLVHVGGVVGDPPEPTDDWSSDD